MREIILFIKDIVESIEMIEMYVGNKNFDEFIQNQNCIIALIIALYFDSKPIIIIEEPVRNIHPYLISRLVNMMKEVSEEKQIIITIHNPEVIKHEGLENIFLVSRNKEGFSTISKPSEKEEVEIFLENELGIEELYV